MGFWIAVLVLVYLAIAVAVIATRPGLHWLVVPTALPIAAAIVLAMLEVEQPDSPLFRIALGLGFVLLASLGGNPLVSLVLSLATRTVRLGTHGGILVTDADSPLPDREILRGGTTIGYVERFALIGSVLGGQPGAIAVIVAVKGLGRFSELENASARERFIIGTLVSLTWAACCTAAVTLAW